MGGAFDPPLDMAGGTADMAGEEEKDEIFKSHLIKKFEKSDMQHNHSVL